MAASAIGAPTPADEYAPVYDRLEMEPLRAGLVASPKISAPLAKLLREPCDKRAIAALAEALTVEAEERVAARAYRGFADACPDSAMEKGRASELFLRIGDADKRLEDRRCADLRAADFSGFSLSARAGAVCRQAL